MGYVNIMGSSLDTKERTQLLNIWSQCFGDCPDYITMFFDTFLPHINLSLYMEGENILGAFYSFPFTTSTGKSVNYIYASAVLPKHRSKGYYSDILSTTCSIPDKDYYLFSIPDLIDWYSANNFSHIYKCKEFCYSIKGSNCSTLCKPTSRNISIKEESFSFENFSKMRDAFLSSYTQEYVVYPVWFLKALRKEKSFSDGIFTIISIDNKQYYIVGLISDLSLIIEETNIPSNKFEEYAPSIIDYFKVSSLTIKIPLSDTLSDSGVKVVYSGQGSLASCDFWAPFPIQ